MEHTWYKCPGNHEHGGCQFCDGGLGLCTVCGGFEGTLTSECSGIKLDSFVLDAIYCGGLDFYKGKWQVRYCEHGKPIPGELDISYRCDVCLRAMREKLNEE